MAGWILLYRQIMDHPMWNERPFSKGQAWVDLLLMVNHADKKELRGNKIVTYQRGQKHTSELKLAEKWGWSRNKVRAFLDLLEADNMISKKGTTEGTTITIENYEVYQVKGTTKGQRKDSERNTNKEYKELNNTIGEFWEQVWGLYPRKLGKGKVSDSQKKKLHSIGIEEITRAIQRYKTETTGKEEKFIQHGSTFFNSGYEDFLDANYETGTNNALTPEAIARKRRELGLP